MKQYTHKEFVRIIEANGFYYDRHSGDHSIYLNEQGKHISIPDKLACVIARRLIKENNLETDIKKAKKQRKMNDNLPVGADKDPIAPYNEPLDVKHRRFVSVTISYYDEVELPPDTEDAQIEEAIIEKVKKRDFPKKVDFDEIIVLEE